MSRALPWVLGALLIFCVVTAWSEHRGRTAAEAKADSLLDSVPVWRAQAAEQARVGDSLQALADEERDRRAAGAAARAALKRKADSTSRVADSALAAAKTAEDSLGTIPQLVADKQTQQARAESAEAAQASAEREAARLRDANAVLQSRARSAESRLASTVGALEALRKSTRRCTLLHPCLGATVGPGVSWDGGRKVEARPVQVTVGLKIDSPFGS